MTKTLTEQWKDGKLPQETFYWEKGKEHFVASEYEMRDFLEVLDNRDIRCLAPVPTYDEYKRLQQRNGKLEKMAFQYTPEEWNTMLRKVERLQKQLKDAEHILDEMGWADRGLIDEYFEKWGVK